MQSKTFALPFILGVEPMKRLLIADFVNHNEYEAIEPQLFDDEINGKGLRILVYRRDKFVDVYHQKGVRVNTETFNIGEGIGILQEVKMEPCTFLITEKGVDLHIAFEDKNNRLIELQIKENGTSKKRLNFLAPVGNEIKHPKQLFLAYMKDFDFVIKKHTTFKAKVGDCLLKPAHFPLARNGKKVYFARYSNNPMIGTINPPAKSPLLFNSIKTGWTDAENLSLKFREGKVIVVKPKASDENISLEFPDGMQNLLELQDGNDFHGRWLYKTDMCTITGGTYHLSRSGNITDIQIQVTRKWIPENLPLNLNLFTYFVKSFRIWPSTYLWKGRVDLSDDLAMNGKWLRKYS